MLTTEEMIELAKTIELGRTFAPVELGKLLGVGPSAPHYSRECTAFAKGLQRALWSLDKKWTVKPSDHGSVVVLTQIEASAYNAHWHNSYLRRARQCHVQAQAVNTSEFTFEQKEEHDHALKVMALKQAALRKVRKATYQADGAN